MLFFRLNHEGLYGLDDFFYARYAQALADGTWSWPTDFTRVHDPLRHRPAVYAPVALLFRLGGVSIWKATLWPLLATLLTTAMVAWVLRPYPLAAAGAVVMLGLGQHLLWLATYLYGDNVAMLLTLLSAATVLAYRNGHPHRWPPAIWAAAFVGTTLAAWLAKETITWLVPAYGWWLVADSQRGRNQRFWAWTAALAVLGIGGYFSYYALATGNAWARFDEIAATNAFLRSGSFAGRPLSALLLRLTIAPAQMLGATGLGVLAWPATLIAWRLRTAPADGRAPWVLLAVMATGQWWLGSTSLAFWNPLALTPRLLAPLTPLWAILAGYALLDWHTGRLPAAPLALGFAVLAGLAHNSLTPLFLALAGLAWWFAPAQRAKRVTGTPSAPPAGWVIAVLFGLLGLRPVYQLTKPSASAWQAQRAVLHSRLLLADSATRAVVFTDPHLLVSHPFWYGFHPPAHLTWRSVTAIDSVAADAFPRAWLLLNEATLRNPELPKYHRIHSAEVRAQFRTARLVLQQGPVCLYEVTLNASTKAPGVTPTASPTHPAAGKVRPEPD